MWAIARATTLELLSEPLCFLITLSALALTVLAPALHYHQFGEPSRMARDAGFSAILLGGLFYAAFGALKTCRREVESGTMQTALAHSVSRTDFFLAKFLGAVLAYGVYVLTVGAVLLTVVNGAEIGGRLASMTGNLARLWGPSLALSLASPLLALIFAALLNRFFRFRFVLTAQILALVLACAGSVYRFDAALSARLLPAAILFALPPLVILSAACAFSLRFKTPIASSLIVFAGVACVPAFGNYCLSDALVKGGSVPVGYFALACAATLPAIAFFLLLGVALIKGKDVV